MLIRAIIFRPMALVILNGPGGTVHLAERAAPKHGRGGPLG
ncbi:hypothetical protein [Spongiactinospora rosea]|nr:hypothetical protein [Spongiactinospora rosea]